jgi:cysteinyl-tRNA synthetase
VLTVHDTLSGRGVAFEPRTPGRVSFYVCGPTVYDVAHLGHGRTAVVFDSMRRYLEWSGYEVTFVSNVTDVDDRIIAKAAAEGTTEPEIAARYNASYWADLEALGCRRPDEIPRATEFIDRMQTLVAELVASGHAYVIEGEGVYFSVESYPGYGDLSHRRIDDLLDGAGARVDVDEQKRSPIDFALWKAAKPGEPTWESPWGPGRPGWHIECSAMSLEILGEGFDLHAGGDDLVFPHHENERAQAEAAGHPFARHWVHSGMVTVAGDKMSKSLQNFTTLAEALEAHDPRAFRLAVLQTHYRSQQELGPDVLSEAEQALSRLDALARKSARAGVGRNTADPETIEAFRIAMDDDFGTPAAVGVIFDAVRNANTAIDARDLKRAEALVAAVRELTDVVGLELRASEDADEEIDALVAQRVAARTAGDYAEADRIRGELAGQGVTLEDGPDGTTWHR